MGAPKKRLIDWLRVHGALIGRDAAVSITNAKAGQVITFSWSYDGRRNLRLSFSGVTTDERNEAMIAWLNGTFLSKAGMPKDGT